MAYTDASDFAQEQEQLAGKTKYTRKKAFTKWVNSQLEMGGSERKVSDLFKDLQDGLILTDLLKILTGVELPPSLGPRTRPLYMRDNMVQFLEHLQPYVEDLAGVTATLLVDGDHSATLDLIWKLIIHFEVAFRTDKQTKADTALSELMTWAQRITNPYGVQVQNFTSSWSDGRAFCALAHCHCPDLLSYEKSVDIEKPQNNLELAFAAFKLKGVERLLDTEDLICDEPDEKSIVTYVSSIRKCIEKASGRDAHVLLKGKSPVITVEVHPRKLPSAPPSDEQLMVPPETNFASTPKKGAPQEVVELAVSPVAKPDAHERSRIVQSSTAITVTSIREEVVSEVSDTSFNVHRTYVESWTSDREKSDSFENKEELIAWATKQVESLKPFQLAQTLHEVKKQKDDLEAVLSVLRKRGIAIFEKTESSTPTPTPTKPEAVEPTPTKPPKIADIGRRDTVSTAPTQYVELLAHESLDDLEKRMEYLQSLQSESMFPTIDENDHDEPSPPRSPGNSGGEEETVKVTITVQWDELVCELKRWMKLLEVCIAAWEKSDSTKKRLRALEEEHTNWGPPAENQDICAQFQQLQNFQSCHVVPFKSEVSAMTELVAQLMRVEKHTPVEELCRCVRERYDWLVFSVARLCVTTQECCRIATEFEQEKQPFEAWVTEAVSEVAGLLHEASDGKSYRDAKEKLDGIQEVAEAKEKEVSTLSDLSTQFLIAGKAIIQEISEYTSKLQSASVTVAAMKEGSRNNSSTTLSIMGQVSKLEDEWGWILDQSIPLPPCNPVKVTLEGIPQGTLKVGQQYRLQADISNAGDGELTAELSGPTELEACTVEKVSSMKYSIFFTPRKTGRHKLHVLFAGTAILLPPLEFLVVDPALVKVTPPTPNTCGVYTCQQPHIFNITCQGVLEQITGTARGRQSVQMINIPVQHLGGGRYIATLIAHTPDKYDVEFYYSGHLVPSSQFLLSVEEEANPGLVRCTVYVSRTDGKISVEADTSRAGTGKLSATAKGGIVGAVVCKTEDEGAGKWLVTFNPPLPDVYTVHVYWNGIDVLNSPFTISTIRMDASKVKVDGPHSNQTPVLAICDTSEAGEGMLTAKCTGNRYGDVSVHVTRTCNNRYRVFFTPPGNDHFILSIFWDELHIPRSPFELDVNVPDASKVRVDGPYRCTEGTGPVHTYIDTSEAGEGKLQVKCVAICEDGGPVEVDLARKQAGRYTAVFMANKPGTYNVDITFNEEPVPQSPFDIVIEEPLVVRKAWGVIEIMLKLPREVTELNGHVVHRPTGNKLELHIDSGVVPGTFKCTFKPQHPGRHDVHINCGRKAIQGSPFEVLVKPRLQPVVTGLHRDQCVDEAVPFQVDCTMAGEGKLVVRSELDKDQKIRNTGRTSILDTVQREKCPGLYDGTFVPKVVGRHLVYIDWCGTQIEGSPFVINAFHHDRPVIVPTNCEPHKPVEIEVFGNIHDILSASAKGDCTGNAQVTIVQNKESRRSVVYFTPQFADTYTVSVFLNESHIEGSPFRIEVRSPRRDREGGEQDPNGKTSVHVSKPYFPEERVDGHGNGFIVTEDIRALSKPLELKLPCTFRVNVCGAGTKGTLDVFPAGPSKCSVTVDRKSDHSGIFIVKCLPSGPGVYTFKVHWNEQPVQGSPLTVTFALPSVITGLNLSTAVFQVGELYKFHAHTDAIGAEDFKVSVNPASGAQVHIFEVLNLNYHVSMLPQKAGEHEISVTYGGQHIFGSPFQVVFHEQSNASKCRLVEDDQPMANGRICFLVDTKGAGKGELTAEVQKMQDQSSVPCVVETVKGAKHQVWFQPQDGDAEYMISIKYNGTHIPRSPFQLVLSDRQPTASVCRAEGDGLQFAELGKESHFVVYTDCTDRNLKVDIKSELEVVKPFTKNLDRGVYSVHYVPKMPGDHIVDILWDDQPIAGSPFTASVLRPLKPGIITVDRFSTGDVTLGKPVRFGITAKDKALAQKLKVVAYLADQAITGKVIRHHDQSYTASFDPTEPGNYRVIVSCGHQQVPGSPFTVRLHEPPMPNKVKAYGRGLNEGVIGHPCIFYVNTTDAGAATLVVEVIGPKGPVKADIQRTKEKRLVNASFLPVHEGEYTVAVLWSDTHINHSPFKVKVHAPNKAPLNLDECTANI